MKKTIITQDKVEALQPYIDEILEAIGYPEALVTDESSVYDFGCFSDTLEHQLIQKIRGAFGLTVGAHEPFVVVAEKIRASRCK